MVLCHMMEFMFMIVSQMMGVMVIDRWHIIAVMVMTLSPYDMNHDHGFQELENRIIKEAFLETKIKCDKCEYTASSNTVLKRHHSMQHNNSANKTPEKVRGASHNDSSAFPYFRWKIIRNYSSLYRASQQWIKS